MAAVSLDHAQGLYARPESVAWSRPSASSVYSNMDARLSDSCGHFERSVRVNSSGYRRADVDEDWSAALGARAEDRAVASGAMAAPEVNKPRKPKLSSFAHATR